MGKLILTPISDTETDLTKQLSVLGANDVSILNWSKSVNDVKALELLEQSTTDQSTTSSTYVDMPQFTSVFSQTNPLVFIYYDVCISSTTPGHIQLLVDNQVYSEKYFGPLSIQYLTNSRIETISAGRHSVKLQWKVDNGGTLTRHVAGKSIIQILNLSS